MLYQTGLTSMKILPRDNIAKEIAGQFRDAASQVNRDRRTQTVQKSKKLPKVTLRPIVEKTPGLVHSAIASVNSVSNLIGKGDIL